MNSALVAKMYGGIIDEVMQKAFADTEVILKQIIKSYALNLVVLCIKKPCTCRAF